MYRISTLAMLLFVLIPTHPKAQTSTALSQQFFEEALSLFNEGEELFHNDLLYSLSEDLDLYYSEALSLFNHILDESNLGKSALYYQLLCLHRLAVIDFNDGLDSIFLEKGKLIAPQFDRFEASLFPIYYNYSGTQYVIKYSNLENFRTDLYNKLFIAASRLKKYNESLRYARVASSISSNSAKAKLQALLFISVAKEELKQFDSELGENGIHFMESYLALSEQEKKDVVAWANPANVSEIAWDEFQRSAVNHASLNQNAALRFRLASGLIKLQSTHADEACQLAINTRSLSNSQLFEMVEYGKADKSTVALIAADGLMDKELTCLEYGRLVEVYKMLGETAKMKKAAEKRDDCLKQVARNERRASRSRLRLVAGIHPGQYLKSSATRDPGAVLGFIKGKNMTLLSFSQVQDDVYQMLDLYLNDITTPGFHPKWDGYRAGLSFRRNIDRFESKKWNYYHGLQFSYAHEKLHPFDDETTLLSTQEKSTATFSPIDHSYRVYYHIGTTAYWYFLGFDLNANFGLSLNTFDYGNPAYSERMNYTFANPLLEFRKDKEFHYGSLIQLNLVVYLIL